MPEIVKKKKFKSIKVKFWYAIKCLQQILIRHSEQRERARQLLEQTRKDGSTTTSPTRVRNLLSKTKKNAPSSSTSINIKIKFCVLFAFLTSLLFSIYSHNCGKTSCWILLNLSAIFSRKKNGNINFANVQGECLLKYEEVLDHKRKLYV